MSNKDSKVWEAFMSSDYVQTELTKQAQSADRSKLYDVDPKNHTELSESATTQGVSAGGGSLVGSGDSKALYTMKAAPVPGDKNALVVEGLEDRHKKMMEVAMKAPTGKQASLKGFTKQSQHMMGEHMMDKMMGEHMMDEKMMSEKAMDEELDSILDEDYKEHEEHDHADKMVEEILADLEKEESEEHKKEATLGLLRELVKIANELDSEGAHEDANEIDLVLKEEVRTLAASLKKK